MWLLAYSRLDAKKEVVIKIFYHQEILKYNLKNDVQPRGYPKILR